MTADSASRMYVLRHRTIECGIRCVQIFILGILAGVYIGFGAFLMLSVGGSCPGLASSNPGLKALVSGLMGLPTGVRSLVFWLVCRCA